MILRYLQKRDWILVGVIVLLIMAQVYLDLRIPDYMTSITSIISGGGTAAQVMDEGWKMIACAFLSLLSAIFTGYLAAWIAASLARRLREKEFDRVESFAAVDIGRFSTASLITRSTNDITQVQTAVAMGLQVIIKAPILAVWAIYKISSKSWQWTAVTGVAILILALGVIILLYLVFPKFRKVQSLTDNVGRVLGEGLKGLRVVRAYNAEHYQQDKFDKANRDLTTTTLFTSRAMSPLMPVMTAVMSILTLSIYWIGSYLINDAGTVALQYSLFSDMVVFSSYAMQVVMAFLMLVIIFMIVPRASVAAKRIEEVIDTEPSISDGPVTEAPIGHEGEVEFRHVGFKYPGAADYVVRDVSFTVHRGETVAFIGSTGCGKTTLLNLIPRFYDVTEGEVLVDGVDVREYTQEALRRKLGYVPQQAVMFTGTVEENIRYGDLGAERTATEVQQAVTIAQAADFIGKLDGGLGGHVAEGGTNFSGGQKQRLSIARAVCRQPEIYLFDDTFSALDYQTDRALRAALKQETAGTTTMVVAQRIGTIMEADSIIVLDNGKVVGIGTHRELLQSCPVYREIAVSQLSAEELGL